MIQFDETPEQAAQKKRDEQARLRELADLRAILATPEGRRFVWALLGTSGVFRQVFSGEETHRAAFLDGNRVHGLRLFADVMEAEPARYQEMMVEAAADEARIGADPNVNAESA